MIRILVFIPAIAVIIAGICIYWAYQPAGKMGYQGILRPHEATKPRASNRLRLVTYNIGYASGRKNNQGSVLTRDEVTRHLDEIALTLQNLDADIIGLQEVDFDSHRTWGINQLDYLAKRLAMPYAAYVILWNKRYVAWPYWPPKYHFGRIISGQAVLSRHPIKSQEVVFFDKPKANPFWYNWFYMDRVIQKLAIEKDGMGISLWHVHLEAFEHRARKTQLSTLAHQASQEHPHFIIGDFNTVSHHRKDLSPEVIFEIAERKIGMDEFIRQSGLVNAESEAIALSFPSWDPIEKIDHIFYRPDGLSPVQSPMIKGMTPSDHLPVVADFEQAP